MHDEKSALEMELAGHEAHTDAPGSSAYVPTWHCIHTLPPAKPAYLPGEQSVHTSWPAEEYLPGVHVSWVGDVDPAGQAYPGLQGPLHWSDNMAALLPYRPGAHGGQTDSDGSSKKPGWHAQAAPTRVRVGPQLVHVVAPPVHVAHVGAQTSQVYIAVALRNVPTGQPHSSVCGGLVGTRFPRQVRQYAEEMQVTHAAGHKLHSPGLAR